jgi:mono/diheme cytochrome c family protein
VLYAAVWLLDLHSALPIRSSGSLGEALRAAHDACAANAAKRRVAIAMDNGPPSSVCASCHGAQLQGISAPALTGSSFARAHVNLSEARATVTTQMPLSAPGSLKPDQYAAIIAYLLSYDCVMPSPGKAPFRTTDKPTFAKVVFGGRSCAPKLGAGHE